MNTPLRLYFNLGYLLVSLLGMCTHMHAQEKHKNGLIPNVQESLMRLPQKGTTFEADVQGKIPSPSYTSRISNKFGFRNHFQSVVRLGDGDHFIVSGSNQNDKTSSLFFISKNTSDPTSKSFVLRESVTLDSTYWHAGGLGYNEGILAIPVYSYDPLFAQILFYDCSDPTNIKRLNLAIVRPGRKAYAVDLVRMKDGKLLVAVLSGRDNLPRRLDFYISRSTDLNEGFDQKHISWLADDITADEDVKKAFSDYQNINLFQQADGTLFLVGLHSTGPSVNFLPGKNTLDLFEIDYKADDMDSTQPTVSLHKKYSRTFRCSRCNFDAGAGLYYNVESASFTLYAVNFWLRKNAIDLTIFSN